MTPKPSFFSNPFGNDDENKVNNYFPISTIGKGVKISKLTKILQLKIFRDGLPAFSTQFWGGMTKNWTMICLYMYFPLITNRERKKEKKEIFASPAETMDNNNPTLKCIRFLKIRRFLF